MSVSFPRLPWWLLGCRKEKEPFSNGSSLKPSADSFKFPPTISQSQRKDKKKWLGKDERRNDGDRDVVSPLTSDGACSHGPETEEPEWSVGWMEPHGPDFQSDDEGDGGFVVLVPCYRGVVEGFSNQLLSAIKNLPDGFSPDGKNYKEVWLSSLQNF